MTKDGDGREIIYGEKPVYPGLLNEIEPEDAEGFSGVSTPNEMEMSPAAKIRKLRVFLNGLNQGDPDLRDLREWLKLKIEDLAGK